MCLAFEWRRKGAKRTISREPFQFSPDQSYGVHPLCRWQGDGIRAVAELHAPLKQNERVPVFLADTMMNKEPMQQHTPGADILSEEIRAAVKVRDQEEILVVMGNPPYFGKSDNPSKDPKGALTFIGKLIQDYYRVDGNSLGEKNPKWLQNDYVKFIRFAQWRIEKSGKGIVAFITDNSYLDTPTFRGMRQSLMNTFDEIRILNLHGNSKKRLYGEVCGKSLESSIIMHYERHRTLQSNIGNKVDLACI